MKFFTFLFVLLSGILWAQTHRFVYEYSAKMDSLNRENIGREIMNLDVTSEGSEFYSAVHIEKDSILMAQFERGKAMNNISIDMRNVKQPKANFRVSKTYPSLEMVYHSSINASNLAVKEPQKLVWEITSDVKDIEGFKAQKAVTTFAGRRWMAWFTEAVQIQDGPYKFCGLPGLILNVEDEKGDHSFKFIGSKTIAELPKLLIFKRKEILVTPEKFNALWNEFKKDPAKNIRMMHSSSEMADTVIFNPDGSPLSKNDLIRRREEGFKETMKRFNNFLEKDLYK